MKDDLAYLREEYEYYATRDHENDLWERGFLRGLQHAYEVAVNKGPRARPGYPFYSIHMEDGVCVQYEQAPAKHEREECRQ